MMGTIVSLACESFQYTNILLNDGAANDERALAGKCVYMKNDLSVDGKFFEANIQNFVDLFIVIVGIYLF